MNISSNISSLQSNQSMMNKSAHNVANSNTNGFVPNNATDNGSVKSQTNLASEMTSQIVVEDVSAVNASAIKAQDEMMGTLLDIKA